MEKAKASLFDDNNDDLHAEWSFNLEESFIETEIGKNQSEIELTQNGNTIAIQRNSYEELVATCDALKAQLNDLEGIIKKKEEEEKMNEFMIFELELVNTKMTVDNEVLVERMKRNNRETMEKIDCLTKESQSKDEKIDSLTTELQSKDEKINTITKKYYELKKRGLQMLEQKDMEIAKIKEEMREQNEKLTATELIAKLEKEKRKKIENEVMSANKVIQNALIEEKVSRKVAEQECLKDKTENMALKEKVNEMSSRGVVILNECPVMEHSILTQRIDVLERQRDILVDRINERSRKK